MSKKRIGDFINYDFHTPNNKEVREYLENNFRTVDNNSLFYWNTSDRWITPQNGSGGLITIDRECGKFIPTEEFKELIGMTKKQFTKSDLKDGMKIVLRNPTGADKVRYVLDKNYLSFDQTKCAGNGAYEQAGYLSEFNNYLTNRGFPALDIMKVIDRDGTVLFERVETPAKSQQEIEMDKLQKQIAELQGQANKLKAAM